MKTRVVGSRLKRGMSAGVVALGLVSCISPVGNPHERAKRQLQRDSVWKLSVISAGLPDKIATKIQGKIKEEKLVCWSRDSVLLEIPLKEITQVTRDTDKDYPAFRWLMKVATQPSPEHHAFGSRRYRDELAARMTLGMFALFAGLFPSRKEVVRLSWTDDEGLHDAEFLTMLAAIKKETGLEPWDLAKERKEENKRRKSLQH